MNYERKTTDEERRSVARWAQSSRVDDIISDITACESALAAAQAEIEHLAERLARVESRCAYYESALCFSPPRLLVLESGHPAGNIEPERVANVVRERDALRKRVSELERALSDE